MSTRRLFTTAQNVACGPITREGGKEQKGCDDGKKKSSPAGAKRSRAGMERGPSRPSALKRGHNAAFSAAVRASMSSSRSHDSDPTSDPSSALDSHDSGRGRFMQNHYPGGAVEPVTNRETHLLKQRALPSASGPPLSLNLVPVSSDDSASAFRVALSSSEGGGEEGQPSPLQPDVTIGFVTGDHLDGWLASVAAKGYGELDLVAYTKDKRPYVNRLTMSAPSPSQPFLAMLQEFSHFRDSVAAPITDSAPSGSDFNNSSSNDTDTMSSNSMKKGEGESANSGSSESGSNEDIPDSDIISFIAADEPPLSSLPPRPPSTSSSSEASVSDRSIVNFLATSKEPLDDVAPQAPPPLLASPMPPPDPYIVAARIDLETAWRAAWALSFGGGSLSLPQSSSETGSLANNGSRCSGQGVLDNVVNPPAIKKAKLSSSSSLSPPSGTTSTSSPEPSYTSVDAFLTFSKASPVPHLLLSPLSTILHCNPAFTTLTGYPLADLEGLEFPGSLSPLRGVGTDFASALVLYGSRGRESSIADCKYSKVNDAGWAVTVKPVKGGKGGKGRVLAKVRLVKPF